MERESFENQEIAWLMNEAFVSVKVDREERPDIDSVFMSVCQMAGGQCGWPLNVLLTPQGEPFFVSTYLPPTTRHGRIGMNDFVARVSKAWQDDPSGIRATAKDILRHLNRQSATEASPADSSWVASAVHQLRDRYDAFNGGFSDAPKFPSPHVLSFLLNTSEDSGSPAIAEMVTTTLRAMRRGGIYDHVGFGFHRYATDAHWLLPHFEKMLYDQAGLCLAYAEAYARFGIEEFRLTALEVVEYIDRDLSHETGTFFSAEDADSEGEEGLFYLWTTDELRDVLGERADEIIRIFNCDENGNYRDEATRQRTGRNVLHIDRASEIPNGDEVKHSLRVLRASRARRIRPLLDDKILADWNGLMIASLADAGRLMSEAQLVARAVQAYTSIRQLLVDPDGRILHRHRNGVSGIMGTVEDYCSLVRAALALYGSTNEANYLADAINLQAQQDRYFLDDKVGGYYQTANDAERLITRLKEYADGALPSANAVSLGNLVRLYALTGETAFADTAEKLVKSASAQISRYPSAYTGILQHYEFVTRVQAQLVVVCRQKAEAEPALKLIPAFPAAALVVHVLTDANRPEMQSIAPFVAGLPIIGQEPTYYLCSNFVCSLPTNSLETLKNQLAEIVD